MNGSANIIRAVFYTHTNRFYRFFTHVMIVLLVKRVYQWRVYSFENSKD